MKSNFLRTVLIGGMIAGILDITAACLLSAILRGTAPIVVLQSVASGLLGMKAYDGGWSAGVLGLVCHFSIATIWSFIYCVIKTQISIPKYTAIVGLVYGIFVYFMMNFVVLPLSAFPGKPTITIRGLFIIMFCVGLPISLVARRLQKSQKLSVKTASLIFIAMFSAIHAEAAQSTATFAGGCYWSMQKAMEKVPGVISVTAGLSGGVEAVELQFDPAAITYNDLLNAYWKNVDPTDDGGQFCDRGERYRSMIFYHDAQQQVAGEQSKKEVAGKWGMKVATEVLPARDFRPVPESEQDYYKKRPYDYKHYEIGCGRERRLREVWKEKKEKS